jgi:DNA polymerase-4
LTDLEEVQEKLDAIIDIMWKRKEAKEKTGKTLTLKIRFADFSTITRSHTSNKGFKRSEVDTVVTNLLPTKDIQEQGIRLLGVTMSNFLDENQAIENQLKIDFNHLK